jgi:hypothetical protein
MKEVSFPSARIRGQDELTMTVANFKMQFSRNVHDLYKIQRGQDSGRINGIANNLHSCSSIAEGLLENCSLRDTMILFCVCSSFQLLSALHNLIVCNKKAQGVEYIPVYHRQFHAHSILPNRSRIWNDEATMGVPNHCAVW